MDCTSVAILAQESCLSFEAVEQNRLEMKQSSRGGWLGTSMDGLPRWIHDPKVDDTAMYTSYLAYLNGRKCDHFLHRLHHKFNESDVTNLQNAEPCNDWKCKRCEGRPGGYMFRWYHPAWYPLYIKTMKHGAWTLPAEKEPESKETEAFDQLKHLKHVAQMIGSDPTWASSMTDSVAVDGQ